MNGISPEKNCTNQLSALMRQLANPVAISRTL